MANREKLNIRLPGDDDHGPNPYDSKTPLKYQSPRWLWDWRWWVAVLVGGVTWYFVGKMNGH